MYITPIGIATWWTLAGIIVYARTMQLEGSRRPDRKQRLDTPDEIERRLSSAL